MRQTLIPILAALLVVGCSAATSPSADAPSPDASSSGEAPVASTASPLSTATPTIAPTDAPTATPSRIPDPTPSAAGLEPPSELKRVAVVERDGVRVRLELERNPMPAGEQTTLTATVRNIGKNVMTWFHDGCAITVSTWGEMSVPWRLGVHHTGAAETFKGRVLDYAAGPSPMPGPIITFVPERRVGLGTFACADIGLSDVIAPGEAITQRAVWEGQANLRWGTPPSGPVTLTGTFGYFWRGRAEPEPLDLDARTIQVALEAWIGDGADAALLSPPEVIDAPTPQLHLVEVDPHTGEVLRTVDRPWDQRLDGFP